MLERRELARENAGDVTRELFLEAIMNENTGKAAVNSKIPCVIAVSVIAA